MQFYFAGPVVVRRMLAQFSAKLAASALAAGCLVLFCSAFLSWWRVVMAKWQKRAAFSGKRLIKQYRICVFTVERALLCM
jgi:hypothetical protein